MQKKACNFDVVFVGPQEGDKYRLQVEELRYSVYVKEMGMILNTSDNRLSDSIDFHSTSLLALYESKPVGTIRVTDGRDGPLEIANQSWHKKIGELSRSANDCIGDITRFMIKREFRGGCLSPLLVLSALNWLWEQGIDIALAASKQGSMNVLHRHYGATIREEVSCQYNAMEHEFGLYYLAAWHRENQLSYAEKLQRKIDST